MSVVRLTRACSGCRSTRSYATESTALTSSRSRDPSHGPQNQSSRQTPRHMSVRSYVQIIVRRLPSVKRDAESLRRAGAASARSVPRAAREPSSGSNDVEVPVDAHLGELLVVLLLGVLLVQMWKRAPFRPTEYAQSRQSTHWTHSMMLSQLWQLRQPRALYTKLQLRHASTLKHP